LNQKNFADKFVADFTFNVMIRLPLIFVSPSTEKCGAEFHGHSTNLIQMRKGHPHGRQDRL
jgi:hypothetical protein